MSGSFAAPRLVEARVAGDDDAVAPHAQPGEPVGVLVAYRPHRVELGVGALQREAGERPAPRRALAQRGADEA